MKLAIFDIDGTLVEGSTERRFWRYLLKRGHQGPRQVVAYLLFWLRFLPGLRPPDTRRRTRRISTSSTPRACARWPRASSPKRFCRASMRRPCSGSRATCGAATPSCSCPERSSRSRGRSRARSASRTCAPPSAASATAATSPGRPRCIRSAPAKLEIAAQFAAEIGATLSEASAYGDSQHDLDLLQAVGDPVAVHAGSAAARDGARQPLAHHPLAATPRKRCRNSTGDRTNGRRSAAARGAASGPPARRRRRRILL